MASYVFDGNTSKYRVTLHDTYKRDNDGKAIVRYSLRRLSDGWIVFSGKDLHIPSQYTPASKHSAIELLGFLTLKPGDTDNDYFKDYTQDQLDWCQSLDCDELSLVVCDWESR